MTEFQEKLLDTFKVFAKFCDDNNLTYFAAYGTCLGAIRHHGFIPWDDDIDVFMLREDYERLLSIRNQLENTCYKIIDIRDNGVHFQFGKFYFENCSVWEARHFPLVLGPWVDIFPVDEWENDEQTLKLYNDFHGAMWNYRKSISVQTWKEIASDFIHLNGLNAPIKITRKLFYSPFKKYYHKKVLRLYDLILEKKGQYLKDWNYSKKKYFEKDWFSSYVEVEFEDTTIKCPKSYDAYLTCIFGDYMTPPPEDQRVEKHNCYYVDLHNKKSIEEIIEEKKKDGTLSEKSSKSLSIKVLIDEIKHRKGY